MKTNLLVLWAFLLSWAPFSANAEQDRALWVHVNDSPGADKEIGKSILTAIAYNEDYEARVCSSGELSAMLSNGKFGPQDTLVLTDCGFLPLEAAGPLEAFIEGGGRLVSLGGTLFRSPVVAWPGGSIDQEFWIGEVGTRGPSDLADIEWNVDFKGRDLLFPAYHIYSCSDVSAILVRWGDEGGITDRLDPPGEVSAFHPRPQSGGWRKDRESRWIPLLEAHSPSGEYRGTVAAMRFTKGMENFWVGFSIEVSTWYRSERVLDYLTRLIGIIHTGGPFLWEGGTAQYTYFPDRPIEYGAETTGGSMAGRFLRFEILDPLQDRTVFTREFGVGETSFGTETLSDDLLEENTPYRVAVSLIESSSGNKSARVVDRLEHPLEIWEPDPNLAWIQAEKGYFLLDDTPWYPYGVNYMPSTGVAREEWRPFEYWLDSDAYDPDVVSRDLGRIAGMGMNSISAFIYHRSLSSWNLLDLLRQCEKRRLRVNLSLRPGTPMNFPWEEVKELIEANRLAENRTVYAYDLAWEPHFEGQMERQAEHGAKWEDWIGKRYETLEKAVDKWGHSPEIVDGSPQVPASAEWYSSGPWDSLLADYAKFLNDLMNERYNEARKKVRAIDENHLVSFRMQYSGDPTYKGPVWIPYEMSGLAEAVDFFAPEAYGRIGDWEQVRPGRFTVDYCRSIAPKLPVFWAEVGLSCWDPDQGLSTPAKLEAVETYYRDFLGMASESYSSGVAFWWYPGGFRTNEKSDYGILNPDGTDRPVTKAIREYAPILKGLPERPEPEEFLPMDRSWKSGGIAGIYDGLKDEYWSHIDRGRKLALWDVQSPTDTITRSEKPFLRFKTARAIVRDGSHNAFTDIAVWRDRYYVAYRKAATHMSMDGVVEIRSSDDGVNWSPAVSFDTGYDDRDVKLFSTPDRLVAQWSSARDEKRAYHSSFLSFTVDGTTWTEPRVSIQNGRAWRIEKGADGAYYCAVNTPYIRSDQAWSVDLYKSSDAVDWEMVSTIAYGDSVNETAIHTEPDGEITAIVRRKFPNDKPLLYRSAPPYMEWKQVGEIPLIYQGPGVWEVNGRRVVIGRYYPDGRRARTAVFELVDTDLHWMFELPSGGDTSYAGLVRKDDRTLWVSYYSEHAYADNLETKDQPSDIYLAEIEIVE